MSVNRDDPILKGLRRQVTLLKRSEGVPHHVAADRIAAQYGFNNWSLLVKNHTKTRSKD